MKIRIRSCEPSRFWFFFVGAILLFAVTTLKSFQAVRSEPVATTYSHGILHVTIPYRAVHQGTGELTVEVLDPEDAVLGRAEHHVEVRPGMGVWHEDLAIANAIAEDNLVWHRLHYRFSYSNQQDGAVEGVASISQILRMPVVHILGQQSYLSGAQAAVRVIVADSNGQLIDGLSSVTIELDSHAIFTGPLNERGTIEAQFRFPAGLAGGHSLRYVVDTPIGSTEFTEQVRLEEKASILLTTEKPIYQPGQTIHVRALALNRPDHEASRSRKMIFELQDSRGNKVFKKITQTDAYGIASAEFSLADEVNLGTYHLRALMGEPPANPANTAEVALTVDKYVLPKFKVAVDFGSDKSQNRGYRPGGRVTGTVRTNYFFGKPVSDAEITVKFEGESAHGKTDRDGAFPFDLSLAKQFAGRVLNQGVARVQVDVTVKDSAGHSETRTDPIIVSESPLIITGIPEGGTLIPNLENQLFILASYPDGKPAKASLRIQAAGNPEQMVTTNDGGIAVVPLRAGAGTETVRVYADDSEGNHASTNLDLKARQGQDQILLRMERALYRAGDRIPIKILSSTKQGTVYVDVVRAGQMVLTRDLQIKNGQAELALTATPELAGAVDVHAYFFGVEARAISDHRLIFVQPADELKIETVANSSVYKPGDDARIQFHVTNTRGEGVQAALGLQVVDEAVFALPEKQPGFAKAFFYLEQEGLKPRFEVPSANMADVVNPPEKTQAAQRDLAARALFSAMEMERSNAFEKEVGRSVPRTKYAEYARRYQMRFQAQVDHLAASLSRYYAENLDAVDLIEAMSNINGSETRDAWSTKLHLEYDRRFPQKRYYRVLSAGPDKKFYTEDDFTAYLEVQTGKTPGSPATVAVGTSIIQAMGGVVGGVPGGFGAGVGGGFGGGVFRMGGNVKQFDAGLLTAPKDIPRAVATVGSTAPHVRSYFPEALYINPEIITDHDGRASIAIPMADSITTWRMAMLASTSRGALGNSTSTIEVFQDFFVDLDLPVTLTQGDRVSIPVAIYNYSGANGDVSLQLKPEDWFSLTGDVPAKTVSAETGRVGGSQFTLEAKRIGKFKFTLSARMKGKSDIVVREIEVVPNGREQNLVFSGHLETTVQHEVEFPANSIPDAGKIFVRLYPSPLSQVIEGMDSILRMPGGCFEQTSSSTYPNVMALDYMRRTKKVTPEVKAKAEGYIANGYQRLLTFEVPGGGFSWFGKAPANKILTAYGLMEFFDMSKVYEVDPNVIMRTQQWLASEQQPDGSWKPDTSFINEGATNRFNSDALRITAYIAWSLKNTGYQGPAIEKAKQFIGQHRGETPDAYTLAVLGNFTTDYAKDRDFTHQTMNHLLDARTDTFWTSQETGVYSTGASANIETTGLAVQALLKSGEASGTASQALAYIASKKGASGTWGTTQATIMALRALLLSTEKGTDVRGTAEILLNGNRFRS